MQGGGSGNRAKLLKSGNVKRNEARLPWVGGFVRWTKNGVIRIKFVHDDSWRQGMLTKLTIRNFKLFD